MFAILFVALLIEIQEEIPHFPGWEGGLMGTKIVNKCFVNKLAFPTYYGEVSFSHRYLLEVIFQLVWPHDGPHPWSMSPRLSLGSFQNIV